MHVGVYGLILCRGKILLINKSRGPYRGLLDLPGGRPCVGETIEETLKREIKEETAIVVQTYSLFNNFACSTSLTDDSNTQRVFYHISMIYRIDTFDQSKIDLEIKEEDVDGSVWLKVDQINLKNCSAPLREVLKFYENKILS